MAGHPEQSSEETLRRTWAEVLESVKRRLQSPQAFETWFKPIAPRTLSPQHAELVVPNAFFVDWIHEHHLPTLRHCLAEVLGETPDIRFTPCEPVAVALAVPPEARPAGTPAPTQRSWLGSQLN